MDETIYLKLVALTEAPCAAMRQRPRTQWTTPELHAADLLELIALCDSVFFYDSSHYHVAPLAQITAADIARFDAALSGCVHVCLRLRVGRVPRAVPIVMMSARGIVCRRGGPVTSGARLRPRHRCLHPVERSAGTSGWC